MIDGPNQEDQVLEKKSFARLLQGNSKLSLYGVMLACVLALKLFLPESFSLKRKRSYHFKTTTLGFFIGDLKVFEDSTKDEVEQKIVQVFPENLRTNVKKVIRPVLVLSEKHEVDPFWVLSVLWTESHFKIEAKSVKGARGLMQVMPETYLHLINELKNKGISLEADHSAEWLEINYPDAFEALGYETLVSKLRNLEVGIYYLKSLHERFDNNYFHATVAYNMGPSWTSERLKNDLPVGKKNHYLDKVMTAYRHITSTLNHNSYVTLSGQSF